MGLIDRLNGWALRRLGSNTEVARVEITPTGLRWRQGSTVVESEWDAIGRVVAFQRTTLAGDEIVLAFEHAEGRVMEVDADWVGWQGLVTRLEQHLSGARPYASWLPDLASSTAERALVVFSRR